MNTKATPIPTQQHIKSMHLKQIVLAALHSGGISRAQLKQALHLSFPSVSALVDELLAAHVLLETDTREAPQRGRPRTLLQVDPRALVIPVAVMTREGYCCALYDCAANCLEESFVPFGTEAPDAPSQHWRPSLDTLCLPLERWSRQLPQPLHTADLLLVIPGSASEQTGLSSSALHMSSSAAFLPRLREGTGWNVIVQNNSDCAAYAEKICRSLDEDFIYIYIGKGVGAGIIRDGTVFQKPGPRAGEIGHISIQYNGRPCSCGGQGCLERYISTTAITQDAQEVLSPAGLRISSFDDVCAAYTSGNARATQLLGEKALLLSTGIHNMLSMQPVSHVILGGEIKGLGSDFLTLVEMHFRSKRAESIRSTTLSYTQLHSGAEALGAVWNYLDHLMAVERLFPE